MIQSATSLALVPSLGLTIGIGVAKAPPAFAVVPNPEVIGPKTPTWRHDLEHSPKSSDCWTSVPDVPAKMVRIFDRDLRAAGIPKRDQRGRTLDVHALRTTFKTLLSKGGVSLRTAQAAMRHADPSLTANVYTDPKLLDIAGALDALPTLPRGLGQADTRERGTGPTTCDPFFVAPSVALTRSNGRQDVATTDKTNTPDRGLAGCDGPVVTGYVVKGKDAVTSPDNRASEWAMQDLNLRPPACRAGALAN
jgi:hypothetical protein